MNDQNATEVLITAQSLHTVENTSIDGTAEPSIQNLTIPGELPLLIEIDTTILENVLEYVPIASMVLVVVGLVGNPLSFIVFSQKRFQGTSSSVLYRILAVVDTLVLLPPAVIVELPVLLNLDDQIGLTTPLCAILGSTCPLQTISAWLLVILCIDRVIAIKFPLKSKQILPRKTIIAITIAMIVAMLLLYFPFVVNVHTFYPPSLPHFPVILACGPAGMFPQYEGIFPWLNLICQTALPFIIITVSNVVLIEEVIKANRKRAQTSNAQASSTDASSMATLLIAVSVVFLVLSIPNCLDFIIATTTPTTPQMAINGQIIQHITRHLKCANHAVNVILYCIGGHAFRCAFLSLIRCKSE